MTTTTILSKTTIRSYDKPPNLNDEQRDAYFLMVPHLKRRVSNMPPERKVRHVLDYGYFAARHQFFMAKDFPDEDVKFVKKMLRVKKNIDLTDIPSSSLDRDKNKILKDFNCRSCSVVEKDLLLKHAVKLSAKSLAAKDIIFRLVGFCWENNIEVPGFKILDRLVHGSFEKFKANLLFQIENESTETQVNLTNKISACLDEGRLLSHRKFNQAENKSATDENANQIKWLRHYHSEYLPLINHLKIDNEVSRNFARWVKKSPNRQIKKLGNFPLKLLNILSFVQTEYYSRQDYAFDAIKKLVNSADKAATKFYNQSLLETEPKVQESTSIIVDYAKSAESIIKVLYSINIDETQSTDERNAKTVHLLKGYLYSANENIGDVCESIAVTNDLKKNKLEYYNKLESSSLSLQGLIMPYLDILEFDDESSNSKITDAIYYLRSNNRIVKSDAPTDFLNRFEKKLVIREDSSINSSLYKALLFIAIREAIRSRTLCLQFSYRYMAEYKDSISKLEYKQNREQLLIDAGIDQYSCIDKLIANLKLENSELFNRVNTNLAAKKNPYLTFTKKNEWSIETPKTDFDTSKFISNFFGEEESISLSNIVREIDEFTEFSTVFKKDTIKEEKVPIPKPLIYALLIANGCNIGIDKLAKASGGKISPSRLKNIDLGVGNIENLIECNNLLVEKIQSLKLPNIHKADINITHTSSDGKKITVNVDSLIASLSFKYFGRERGVVINSFLDEKGSFPVMNICPSTDREAAYMLDGIIGMSELFSDEHMHSTDNHGITHAIFAASMFTNVNLAPRIKNLGRKTLFGFNSKDVKKRNSDSIAPNKKADINIIIENWEDILRIMASIKLGRCSASQIFAHMSSSEKQSNLYKAFKELGGILQTNHILRYYDDLEFRQKIQKRLSIGELAQKFKEAIFFGRKGKFQVGEPDEMQRIAMCTTILQNCIVLWNYIILTEALINKSPSEQEDIIASISRGSILSWKHVTMLGLYLFDGKYRKRIKYTYEKIQKAKIGKVKVKAAE